MRIRNIFESSFDKLHPNVSSEAYWNNHSISSTELRLALDSMKIFHGRVFGDLVNEETKAMNLGRIVHHAILEPEDFQKRYRVMPIFEGKTQKGELTTNPNCNEVKAKRASWLSDLPNGAIVVTEEEQKMIYGIAQSIQEHPQGPDLFKNGQSEVSGFWTHEKTGIRLKFRADFVSSNYKSLVDLKSTVSSKKEVFGNQIFRERYDFQVYKYARGIEALTGVFPEVISLVAVEKEPPYESAVYYFEKDDLKAAESDFEWCMERVAQCMKSNVWPARQAQLERVFIPVWFVQQCENAEAMRVGN